MERDPEMETLSVSVSESSHETNCSLFAQSISCKDERNCSPNTSHSNFPFSLSTFLSWLPNNIHLYSGLNWFLLTRTLFSSETTLSNCTLKQRLRQAAPLTHRGVVTPSSQQMVRQLEHNYPATTLPSIFNFSAMDSCGMAQNQLTTTQWNVYITNIYLLIILILHKTKMKLRKHQ